MIHRINIVDLLEPSFSVPLVDVRTPAEHSHGHIPGAFNIPLFSNEERVRVGTTYKQQSREKAILLGFDLTGSKWSGFIREALAISLDKKIALHCWRGGMRSGAMAWALDLYGFEVYLLEGGYKSYRRWCHSQFELDYNLRVIGGKTGSGKTRILQQMREMGHQMIDLEDLAQHQGSAFGSMNRLVQPSQEQFENNMAWQLKEVDRQTVLWVEDESINIGKRTIPRSFYNQMQLAPLIDLQVSTQQRVEALTIEYGLLEKPFLVAGTERIRKRLGPLRTKQALEAIVEDHMEEFIRIALGYYDKTYEKSLSKKNKDNIIPLTIDRQNLHEAVGLILDLELGRHL
ncbi:tRNA 2-selenouridine synthase [Dyadobacter jejuensis]|uniref:tRNA 2-selenouridine synthase n=1 Tax=Dyadobacter jejuensis TaxID=1082580 RepID=A0A316AHZ0_9BACT|nr:tRNA 2-selenouridine(34) synthase MnmH [Dyadobacter jejuensis]PWJ57355.1 tRNA 2-selenouridine synthase [Dyadobacter jejuensis]